ncbi:MAG: carboxypeptidase regulatory-like domain-containing protein [Acidobacteriia bacterium]|nr:carboxypeptidase regulatory-like domain-containing protein [Terriglobia bacterium]
MIGLVLGPARAFGQSESASVSGRVTDQSAAVVPEVEIELKNVDTNIVQTTKTNQGGFYAFSAVKPGKYLMNVRKQSFRSVSVTGIVLNVQDNLSRNFVLQVGSFSESITVTADAANVNTTDATVSTVIDRKFVESMPLNGRSFQDLLTLTPGVAQVPTVASIPGYGGEISVNGQRTEANYFTVDGVSANTGTVPSNFIGGAGFSGSVPGETVLGTTQSMVSIDALQEFRVSTSNYSAEYGRTPGGQFSFSTRSGANNWHGTAYDYFRNDVMDANNWFNDNATPQVPKLAERQNDFGGTLGGPIVIPGLYNGKDKTFFFFSYEGLRLTVPQPSYQSLVPDMNLRQQAPAALQPFLNAFAIPNGGEDGLNDGLAFYNLAYSAPSSLDNVSIRIDHSFGDRLKLFGRYADSPSSGWTQSSSTRATPAISVRSLTLGATSRITGTQANELRFNITQNRANFSFTSTNFGGATPLNISDLPGPNGQPLTPLGTELAFGLEYGGFPSLFLGENRNAQRQFNVTDSYSWSHGVHQVKFGVDWRRLTTFINPITTSESGYFSSEALVLANSADFAANLVFTVIPVEPIYHNFSAFVQDEWRTTSRLSLSLGLRWDINPAPGNLNGPSPYTVDQTTNLATTKLAPAGTPLWNTDWHGFAPRVGLAYQLRQAPGHETVLRTGFGLFYDMGNTLGSQGFTGVGFQSGGYLFGVPFPLTSAQLTLPPPSVAPPYDATIYAFAPNLSLPRTAQWNFAVEQGLGAQQTLTVSYVASSSRKLLTSFEYFPAALGNPNFALFGGLTLTSNLASSDYNSLQVKYQKSLSRGLQALASYTWSHSIDDASSNFQLYELLRASSDLDIRHDFQAAVTYDVPGRYSNALASAVLKHWALDTRISARSALPVDIIGESTIDPATQRYLNFHPDLISGQPVYLYGSQYPGGRIINYNAFTLPPSGTEGNVPRNFARGFGAWQANLAIRRNFPIYERLHLQFRAEAFNIFNHPNFGFIYNQLPWGPSLFGRAGTTLNQTGSLSSLYQIGGPRSIQLALKLEF